MRSRRSAIDVRERDRRARQPHARDLVIAARELIFTHGVKDARILDIERLAGVGSGSCFYYFGSKDRLLAEVLRCDYRERLEATQTLLADAGSIEELYERLCLTITDVPREAAAPRARSAMEQIEALVIDDDQARDVRAAARRHYREALAAALRLKVDGGAIVLALDEMSTAAILIALNRGLLSEALADDGWDRREVMDGVALLVRALLTPAR